MGLIFVDCDFFVNSFGYNFVDAFVTVSITKITVSKIVFFEDLNSLGRVTNEYYENWATTNSNASTVYQLVSGTCSYQQS